MKLKLLLATTLLSTAVISPVMAGDQPGSGPNPFSDCGIGAALFDNDVGATISNVIWDIGLTAMTSATASPETCSTRDVEAAEFVLESHDSLMEETARGEGRHLDALMNMLNVDKAERPEVVTRLRADMVNELASADYASQTRVERAERFYFSVMDAVSTES